MSISKKTLAFKNFLIILLLLSPFGLLILVKPEDWLGIVLIPMTILFILTQKVFIKNLWTTISVLAILFTKIIISLTNSNYFTIYGANDDATTFFQDAASITRSNITINFLSNGAELYKNFLAFIYNFS